MLYVQYDNVKAVKAVVVYISKQKAVIRPIIITF